MKVNYLEHQLNYEFFRRLETPIQSKMLVVSEVDCLPPLILGKMLLKTIHLLITKGNEIM